MAKEIFNANTYRIMIVNDTYAKFLLQYNPLFDKEGNHRPNGWYWPLALMDLSDAIQQGVKELQVDDKVNGKTYNRSILDILKQHATVLDPVVEEPEKVQILEFVPTGEKPSKEVVVKYEKPKIEEVEPEQEEAPTTSEQLSELGEAEEVAIENTETPNTGTYDGDLTKVKGIGAKTAALLADNGIPSLQELAEEAAPYITGILTTNNRKFKADPQDWIDQAKEIIAKEAL